MRMKKTRAIIAWIGMCVILSLVLSCKKSHTVSGVWRFDDLKENDIFFGDPRTQIL